MTPTTDKYLLQPLTDDKIVMGLYPVMFGWRVRAQKKDDHWYSLDWCCGDDPKVVWATYEIMKMLLDRFPMDKLPTVSELKPWNKDPKFIAKIALLLQGEEVPMVGVRPSLEELREQYYQAHKITSYPASAHTDTFL